MAKSLLSIAHSMGGRPPHYDNPEALMNKAIEYFEACTTTTGICKPTMSGLTFHVGFKSRNSWIDYKERSQEFSDVVERLKLFVESCYERNLHGFAWAGSAFALRNINSTDWKDEITQNQIVTNVAANFGSAIQPTPESGANT
jgi:hypothetical protein